jgi:hypothetical protein
MNPGIRMNSIRLVLVVVLSQLMFTGCGKNTPLEPEPLKHPELIPLAEGASWVYRYSYNYSRFLMWRDYERELDLMGWKGDTLVGTYTLTVEDSRESGDSIFFFLKAVTIDAKTVEPVTENYRIVQCGDSLWYGITGQSNLSYMMPLEFSENAGVDVAVFVPSLIRADKVLYIDSTYFPKGIKSEDGNISYSLYENSGGGGGSKQVQLDARGIYSFYSRLSRASDILPAVQTKGISLIAYTPGTP